MYQSIAKYYNKYTEDIDYAAIAEFAHEQFSKSVFFRNADKPIVADIACGTGSLIKEMCGYGYDMIGIDISPDMLDIAKANVEENVLWLCQDMKELDLYGTVAGMISITDSINHILFKKDLESFFKRVYNFLEYTGIFIFDVLTENYFRDVVGNNTFCESDEYGSCIWTSTYYPGRKKIAYDITLYNATDLGDDIYRRTDDYIEERAWTEDELNSAITKAGLSIKNVYSSIKKGRKTENDNRRYYICYKKQ